SSILRQPLCAGICPAGDIAAKSGYPALAMTEPSEKQIQQAVIDHWRKCGRPHTLVAAIPNQYAHGQPGLTPGLSDLIVFGGSVVIGFIELKARGGRLSAAQQAFMQLLDHCGIKNAVTFGRDQPIAVLESWGIVKPQVSM